MGTRTLTMKEEKRLEIIQRVYRGELANGKYRGFNDHHLTEKLREQEKSELSRETIRQVLRFHGILSPRKKRTAKHRSRRERKEAEGMMLQVDGSPHDWLEGRGPSLCLVGAIDDATGKVPRAFFEPAESSWADREPTLEEQLKNQRPTTEVERGLEELGVTLILAGSPQAKGRIERLWGTFQDRLVSELRLAKAKTLQRAQAVLDHYLSEHNRKFSKPTKAQAAWRKVTSLQIEQALCFKQHRTVANDNTVT